MLSSIQELAAIRRKWVEANRENNFEEGIKRLLTDLYPDNAHFIYELLQNAEDARASEVRFILNKNRVEFEHNGKRLFSIKDVDAITSIGVSNKKDDPTSIGKFGVGFKAVFVYTETPEIASGSFHFRIRDLVVPEADGLSVCATKGNVTRFVFPFDNPAKPPEKACAEIEKNLWQLDENTLLFLKNIHKIEYVLPDLSLGCLKRVELKKNRVAIDVQHPGELEPTTVRFLRFDKEVEVTDEKGELQSCRISVAYSLEHVKEQTDEDTGKNSTGKSCGKKAKKPAINWRIKPLDRGRVSIYFPAEKETSNLRFHLHAPFASTVARDSVRDCYANNELRDHLAQLIVESMTAIRDQGLLNVICLATLPNEKDNLPDFYKPIMEGLIEAFQNNELTPMKQGGHAAAFGVFRGRKTLSDLIDDDDIVVLLGEDYLAPMWVANPSQRNQREDNFLSLLNITEWSDEDLVSSLHGLDRTCRADWMGSKDDAWHQRLYAFLEDHADSLDDIEIIRISDGTYRKGSECFFPTEEVECDKKFPRVAKGVYVSDREENKKARRFLEAVGVRDVNASVEVENILNTFYSVNSVHPDHKQHCSHMRQFIQFLDSNPNQYILFKNAHLFMVDRDGGIKWHKPEMIYLEEPYLRTGLRVFYGNDEWSRKYPLSSVYQDSGINSEEISKFAKRVGATVILKKDDLFILTFHFKQYKLGLNWSWLLWNSLVNLGRQDIYILRDSVHYHKGWGHYGNKHIFSDLCMNLRNIKWIPQRNGERVEFVQPRDAIAERLPEDFEYQTGWYWLHDLEFGQCIKERREAQQREQERETEVYTRRMEVVRELGFESPEEAEEIARLTKSNPEEFRMWKKRISATERPTFPCRSVASPERRQEHLEESLLEAANKTYEKRGRNIRITRGTVNPSLWLREKYTNEDGQMVCQICKEEMPFKKPDGEYYFEAVEALSKDMLVKEHEAQYFALCPLCAARYKVFIKENQQMMKNLKGLLENAKETEVPLILGELKTSIQFVETHFQDLKTILGNKT